MTETQATAGTAAADNPGTSADAAAGASVPAAGKEPEASGRDGGRDGTRGGGADEGAGRSAVGRATVPGDKPSAGSTTPTTSVKYTRAPGMPAPPDAPAVPLQGSATAAPGPGSSGSAASLTKGPGGGPAVARASVRGLTGSFASVSTGAVAGSTRVTEAVRAARATVSAAAGRGARRARLHLKRIDPWSVMKFSFAVSFVLFVVVIVATSVLYLALDAMGVFGSVNKALFDMVGATGGDGGSFKITAKGVIGGAALIGLVNVVLFTALATLGAFIYNVCADLVGGVELTLSEKE